MDFLTESAGLLQVLFISSCSPGRKPEIAGAVFLPLVRGVRRTGPEGLHPQPRGAGCKARGRRHSRRSSASGTCRVTAAAAACRYRHRPGRGPPAAPRVSPVRRAEVRGRKRYEGDPGKSAPQAAGHGSSSGRLTGSTACSFTRQSPYGDKFSLTTIRA